MRLGQVPYGVSPPPWGKDNYRDAFQDGMPHSSWAKIRLGNGTEGWVMRLWSRLALASVILPLATVPAAPQPPVPVAPGAVLNCISGPGFGYPVTGSVSQGLQVNTVGRNAANTWLRATPSKRHQGWAAFAIRPIASDPKSANLADHGCAVSHRKQQHTRGQSQIGQLLRPVSLNVAPALALATAL